MMQDWAVGDKVIIKKVASHNRNSYWNSVCESYAGKVVTIRTIISSGTHWTFEEEPSLTMLRQDIQGYADPEREAERQRITKERIESAIYTEDKIRVLAESVFGEERVWVDSTPNPDRGEGVSLYIHFPMIEITNSRRKKHTIRDIYVKFHIRKINMESAYNVCSIDFSGTRTTFTLKEYVSYYIHSHLPARSIDDSFKTFCLGSSVFGTIISDLSMDLSEENWMLLLLSLENYLNWESIEGGPHIRMASIAIGDSHLDERTASTELARIIKGMPTKIWNFDGKFFKVAAGNMDFVKYLDEFFPIREAMGEISKAKIESMIKAANETLERYPLIWKGVEIPRVVIPEEETEKVKYKPISPQVIDIVRRLLDEKLNNFIKDIRHEKTKEKQRGKIFYSYDCCSLRKDGASKQTNVSDIKEAEKAD